MLIRQSIWQASNNVVLPEPLLWLHLFENYGLPFTIGHWADSTIGLESSSLNRSADNLQGHRSRILVAEAFA